MTDEQLKQILERIDYVADDLSCKLLAVFITTSIGIVLIMVGFGMASR